MIYQAVFGKAPDGTIWGYIPELPGATGSGDTLEEARVSLVQGVKLWINDAKASGDAVPEPSTIAMIPIDPSK